MPLACIFRSRGGVKTKTTVIAKSAVIAVASPSERLRGTVKTRRPMKAVAAASVRTRACDVGIASQLDCFALTLALDVSLATETRWTLRSFKGWSVVFGVDI